VQRYTVDRLTCETVRMWSSSSVDERTRFEIYSPPFFAAVAAGVQAVMCSYVYSRGCGTALKPAQPFNRCAHWLRSLTAALPANAGSASAELS
jgi:hypothetical protein